MKLSCNGCRVLRKGCSKSCIIRPCLAWIQNPEGQAHSTMFLAKFYGRTGLLNLINSGPDHLRPAIFKSLLYEACGRIVNPIYGSVGLLSSNSWPMVEAAVDAVLKGKPIVSVSLNDAADVPVQHPTCDIRHLSKGTGTGPDLELHKVSKKMRTQFKRTHKGARAVQIEPQHTHEPELSHNSSNEHPIEPICSRTRREVSVDTVDAASHVSQGEPGPVTEHDEVVLDLTLGFGFEPASSKRTERCYSSSIGSNDACSLSLGLQLTV